MSIGVTVMGGDVALAARVAALAEEAGFDSAGSAEFYDRSATVSLAAMAVVTSRIRLGSAIAYAFGRAPLLTAAEARDLDELSGGRFVLGLGSGTRAQIAVPKEQGDTTGVRHGPERAGSAISNSGCSSPTGALDGLLLRLPAPWP